MAFEQEQLDLVTQNLMKKGTETEGLVWAALMVFVWVQCSSCNYRLHLWELTWLGGHFCHFSHFLIVRGPELNLTPVLWLPSVVVDYLGTNLLIFSV